MKEIENNNKSLVILEGIDPNKNNNQNKYETKERRIANFKNRRKTFKEYREDLSRALVPRTNNSLSIYKRYMMRTKRPRNRLIFEEDNILKKHKINITYVNTLVKFNKKVVNNVKYDSKEKRIANFRKKMKILNCFKEDLSKALVVYNRKRGRKRLRNLIVFNKLLRKRQKTYASRMRTLVVYKGKVERNYDPKYSRENRISEFKKRRYIKYNPPEDLSRALVVYKFKKEKFFNKARKRKKTMIEKDWQHKKRTKKE